MHVHDPSSSEISLDRGCVESSRRVGNVRWSTLSGSLQVHRERGGANSVLFFRKSGALWAPPSLKGRIIELIKFAQRRGNPRDREIVLLTTSGQLNPNSPEGYLEFRLAVETIGNRQPLFLFFSFFFSKRFPTAAPPFRLSSNSAGVG